MRNDPHPPDTLPLLAPLFAVRRQELAATAWSAMWLFCALGAYYVLKPLRSVVLQTRIGVDHKGTAILITTALIALQSSVYGWLVPRLSRRRLVLGTFVVFLACLALFAVGLRTVEGVWMGYAFYAWVSTYSLLVVSQFWSLAAERWSHEQGVRLFGLIGVGAVAGGVAGNVLVVGLARRIGTSAQLGIAAGLIALCMWFAHRLLARHAEPSTARAPKARRSLVTERGAAALVAGSPYLIGIAAMTLLLNVVNTSNEWVLDKVVSTQGLDPSELAAFYGRYQLEQNVITMLVQVFLTSRVQRALGPRAALLVHPLVSAVGGVLFLVAPTLGVIRTLKVAENAADYSIHSNTKELLYVPVSALEKYSAKNFNDTFVVRAGDSIAAGAIHVVGSQAAVTGIDPALSALVFVGTALAAAAALVVLRVTAQHRARVGALAATDPTTHPPSPPTPAGPPC